MEIQLLRGDDGSFFEERENGITLTAVAIMHPVEDGLCGTHLQMDRGYTLPPSVPPHGWDPTVHPLVRAMTGDWTITIYLPPGRAIYHFDVDGAVWLDPRGSVEVRPIRTM